MEKISSKICLNGDLGINGRMYGGKLMFLMDEAAAIYAREYCCETVVSRRFSAVEFREPVLLGEILEFWADNPRRGRTSLCFEIKVLVAGRVRFHAECVFVAVDSEGNKKEIDWDRADRQREAASPDPHL